MESVFFLRKSWLICLEEASKIGTKLSLSIVIVGVFERESLTDTPAEAFGTECHSAGIELIILMRKKSLFWI